MTLPVWICMPHATAMVQILQSENDREAVVDVKLDDAQKVKSTEADVMSQIPKPKFDDCSIDGNDETEVLQTIKASIILQK